VGQLDNAQNVLNIQPVVPLHLNQDWNLITRLIMPVVYQPPFFRGDSTDFGLGGLQSSLLLFAKEANTRCPRAWAWFGVPGRSLRSRLRPIQG
jgi:hypothetical protein